MNHLHRRADQWQRAFAEKRPISTKCRAKSSFETREQIARLRLSTPSRRSYGGSLFLLTMSQVNELLNHEAHLHDLLARQVQIVDDLYEPGVEAIESGRVGHPERSDLPLPRSPLAVVRLVRIALSGALIRQRRLLGAVGKESDRTAQEIRIVKPTTFLYLVVLG